MADVANPNLAETTTVVVAEEKGPKEELQPPPPPPPNNKLLRYLAGGLMMLTFILCLPIMASVIWLSYVKDYDCEGLLGLPRLQIGICIGLVFVILTSIGAVVLRTRLPMVGVMLAVVPLLIMFIVGLAFVGAYKMESRTVGSPSWLKTKVENNNKWKDIKTCIYDSQTCQQMAIISMGLNLFDTTALKLTPLESGCCQPPSFCDMEAMNATFWMKKDPQRNRAHPFDTDCGMYNNDRNILCYDCESCRQGFLTTLESKWRTLGVFIVCMSALLLVSQVAMFLATMAGKFGP